MKSELIKEMLDERLVEEVSKLLGERFKRVVRGGKIIRKKIARKGFKIVKSKGSTVKMKRMTVQEKRKRSIAIKRAWKKGKAARLVKSKRKLKRSLIKRKGSFGR